MPPHPGTVLLRQFMEPRNLHQKTVGYDTGMIQSQVSELVSGRRSFTVLTALRLARYFDTTPEFWLNLQQAYDVAKARRQYARKIAEIKPLRDYET